MSACNIFRFWDAIVVWSDGAIYHASGHLAGVTSKVGFMPHLNAVLVTRGPALVTPLLASEFGAEFATFSDLVDGLGHAVDRAADRYARIFEECDHGSSFEVYVAGWQGTQGPPETYRVTSSEPGDVQQLPPINVTPGNDEIALRLKAEFPHITDDSGFARPEVGLRLIELQREMIRLEQVEGLGEICAVGGFAQITLVTRQFIQTQIVHRWPDRVGELMGREHERRPEGATVQ